MYLPIPLKSFTSKIVSHRTFIKRPTIFDVKYFNTKYVLYRGEKFRCNNNKIQTFIDHKLENKLITSNFETIVDNKYNEFMSLTKITDDIYKLKYSLYTGDFGLINYYEIEDDYLKLIYDEDFVNIN